MLSSRGAGLLSGLRTRTQPQLLPFLAPCQGIRHASGKSKSGGGKGKKDPNADRKKKKTRTNFIRNDIRFAKTFSLVDAMRYIRAFEVGQSPISVKYDLAVSLKTQKNGPVIRNQTKLPHAVDTTQRVAVICKPDSLAAKQAIANGASLVGEDVIFDAVKAGRIEFERCLCHVDSKDALAKSGVARVLGPRNLMPNEKRNTIVKDVKAAMTSTIGGTQYREKIGVIRVPIGQLRYTPEQLQANIKAFMTKIKADIAALSDRIGKDIHEVVLSSTNAPGFPLSGEYRTPQSLQPTELHVL